MPNFIFANKFYTRLATTLLNYWGLTGINLEIKLQDPEFFEDPRMEAEILYYGRGVYTININRKSKDTKTKCLTHEMTHLHQWETEKLIYIDGLRYWEGQAWHPETPYSEQPWEIEAFQNESKLAKLFKKR